MKSMIIAECGHSTLLALVRAASAMDQEDNTSTDRGRKGLDAEGSGNRGAEWFCFRCAFGHAPLLDARQS